MMNAYSFENFFHSGNGRDATAYFMLGMTQLRTLLLVRMRLRVPLQIDMQLKRWHTSRDMKQTWNTINNILGREKKNSPHIISLKMIMVMSLLP